MTWDAQTVKNLDEKLDPKRVKTAEHVFGDYLGVEDVIQTANRIFGYDGWSYSVTQFPHVVFQGTAGEFGKGDVWMSSVKVSINGPEGWIEREDSGTNIQAGNAGSHVEMSVKGSVSAALKRAFRSFGNQFGLSLYFDDQDLADEPPPEVHPLVLEVREELEKAKVDKSVLASVFGHPPGQRELINWLHDEDGRTAKSLVKLAMDMQANKQGVPA